jgi:hypothetical protein
MAKRSHHAAVDGDAPAERGGDGLPSLEYLDRIINELAACEALGDVELARHAGRKLLAAIAGASDALLLDGGRALHAAPDKVGAFFDKAAVGLVQALDGLNQRTLLMQAAAPAARDAAPGRPRADDPLAAAIAAWGSASGPEIVPRAQRSI